MPTKAGDVQYETLSKVEKDGPSLFISSVAGYTGTSFDFQCLALFRVGDSN